MAETDPKTVQDLTSVVRDGCVLPRPRHAGAAPARPVDPDVFSVAVRVRISRGRVSRGFARRGLWPP
uniref:Heat shock factor binding protein 1 n=1 Tax=Molossus molossus TaxID=27622 RepID=A0A7J8C7X1_MOLMO|nr:heat shock factor binding protein 1 [Molossus molossus]